MVSEFIKVRNTDFRWINMTIHQTLQKDYRVWQSMNTENRLEYTIESKSFYRQQDKIKLIIYSDGKRAGQISLSVEPFSASNRHEVDGFALDVWKAAATALRFSLAGEGAMQKCWNCFEERDFRDNFCRHCGKS
ncbi:MAG: hypothetical protein ACXAD7_21650 [Candidatus Kariarchaeaceae archaeon]|jgi:hypothetical protein